MKTIKKCKKCSKSKPIYNFRRHENNADGYQIWCESCMQKYQHKRYQVSAEDLKSKIYTRREKVRKLLDRAKLDNPCRCGEDEMICLGFYPLSDNVPKVKKTSGLKVVREALDNSAILCSNCRIKVDAGLQAPPTEPLDWEPGLLEALEPKKPEPKPEPVNPALPPGVQ